MRLQGVAMCSALKKEKEKLAWELTQVKGVFTTACNLETADGHIITLLPDGKQLVPFGVNVQGFKYCQNWNVGKKVIVFYKQPSENNGDVAVFNCEARRLYIDKTKFPEEFSKLQAELFSFIKAHKKAGGINEFITLDFYGDEVSFTTKHKGIEFFIEAYQNGWGKKTAVKAVHGMIGLGAGLTPSADDFLTGMLFTLDLIGSSKRQALQAGVLPNLTRTTYVSKEMLWHACNGRYSTILLDLAQEDKRKLNDKLHEILRHGHTSGYDTLFGMLVALTLKK